MTKKKNICPVYHGEPILSLTMDGVIVRDLDNIKGKRPSSFNGYQRIQKGNLLMCLFDIDVTPRCVGLVSQNGLTSPAYSQFVMAENINVKYYYFYYLFLDFTKELLHLAKNLRHSLTEDQLGSIKVPVPSPAEQKKIADFLDKKCGEVDALAHNIQQQIDTLEQYKRAIITETVTKGLNPSAPMKDSGIPWIGPIPQHWELSRIKYHTQIKGRIGFRGYTEADLVEEGEGAITLSPSNLGNMAMDYTECSYISWFKYNESPEIQIINGDILFVKTGSSYGKTCLVQNLPMSATINPQLVVFKKISINHKLLAYILQTTYIKFQSELAVVGGTIPTMSQNKIGNFFLVLPPKFEQQAIAEYLDKKCGEIDAIIQDKQQQLEKLEEYKKAIIFEYVTGKKPVPEEER